MCCWLLRGNAVTVLTSSECRNANYISMYIFALGAARHTIRNVRPYFLPCRFFAFGPFAPRTPRNGPKRAQTGGCAAGCCSPQTACRARPIGHEASRNRTEVPCARSRSVLGPVFGGITPGWGRRGADWGGSLELKTRVEGGHHWVRSAPEFLAGAGGDFFCDVLACCLLLVLITVVVSRPCASPLSESPHPDMGSFT